MDRKPLKLYFTEACCAESGESMMTSSNGNIFRVTGPLYGEFTGHRRIPLKRLVTRSLDVSFICAWINGWVKNCEAGDLRPHRARYDVTVMMGESYTGTMHAEAMSP